MNFPHEIIKKFSQQDATLAAAYSQLAAHALSLDLDRHDIEDKVMEALQTDLVTIVYSLYRLSNKDVST